MVQTLNKITGSIVGGIYYPLKSLTIDLLRFPLVLFNSLRQALSGIWNAFLEDDAEIDYFLLLTPLLILLIISPETLLIMAAVTAAGALGLISIICLGNMLVDTTKHIFNMFKNFFTSIGRGVSTGYKIGLFSLFDPSLKQEESLFDPSLKQEEVITHSLFNLTEIKNPNSVPFTPLTAEEQQQAERLNISPQMLARYKDLHEKLSTLDTALKDRERKTTPLANVKDELTLLDVTTPVIFMKMYKVGHEWKVVPVSTYLIDPVNILGWFNSQLTQSIDVTHPFTRDSIVNPELFEKATARYVMIHYSSMGDCQELVEAANFIRSGLVSLAAVQIPTQASDTTPGVVATEPVHRGGIGLFDRRSGSTTPAPTPLVDDLNDPRFGSCNSSFS